MNKHKSLKEDLKSDLFFCVLICLMFSKSDRCLVHIVLSILSCVAIKRIESSVVLYTWGLSLHSQRSGRISLRSWSLDSWLVTFYCMQCFINNFSCDKLGTERSVKIRFCDSWLMFLAQLFRFPCFSFWLVGSSWTSMNTDQNCMRVCSLHCSITLANHGLVVLDPYVFSLNTHKLKTRISRGNLSFIYLWYFKMCSFPSFSLSEISSLSSPPFSPFPPSLLSSFLRFSSLSLSLFCCKAKRE